MASSRVLYSGCTLHLKYSATKVHWLTFWTILLLQGGHSERTILWISSSECRNCSNGVNIWCFLVYVTLYWRSWQGCHFFGTPCTITENAFTPFFGCLAIIRHKFALSFRNAKEFLLILVYRSDLLSECHPSRTLRFTTAHFTARCT